MSHQVRLSSFNFTNLDLLIQAITQEGLRTTDNMHGYSSTWIKGDNYGTDRVHGVQKLAFGIECGNHATRKSPCGITNNADGTYSFIGDSYGISYKGSSLDELGARLNQRYQIAHGIEQAAVHGWETISAPSELLHYTSKDEVEVVFEKQQLVQACL